jgi:hypothetical protein
MQTAPQTSQDNTPETEQKPPVPPFMVPNRSRAERLAKLLWGPTARVWINRTVVPYPGAEPLHGCVQVGIPDVKLPPDYSGPKHSVKAEGLTFSDALHDAVKQYVKGGNSYEDTKARIRRVAVDALVEEFVEEALSQFPEEYAKDLEMKEKRKKLNEKLKKGQPLLPEDLSAMPAKPVRRLDGTLSV